MSKEQGKGKKVIKMSKHVESHVKPLKDEEIETWAYHFIGRTEDEEAQEKVEKLATRVANIGDITALAKFFDKEDKVEVNRQLNTIVQRLTIMEYIINDKLGVSNEEMGEYVERYEKEMDDLRKAMEDMMKEDEDEDADVEGKDELDE